VFVPSILFYFVYRQNSEFIYFRDLIKTVIVRTRK